MRFENFRHVWPIDPDAGKAPVGWPGWPDQKQFALVLTHDVETTIGQEKCHHLMEWEKSLGFISSFNFVPERYHDSPKLRHYLTKNGFEVGVHGLKHDGRLYQTRKIFNKRAIRINHYLKEWGAIGFRSPSSHHNLDWIHDLDVKYDASTFDTDPFEPQSDGVGTIFPFWVQKTFYQDGYIELPYTLPQDFTLFIILREKNIDLWKQKLDWIVEKGGMVLLNSHPDYMNFGGKKFGIDDYPAEYYEEFLKYVKNKYKGDYWHGLPKDMSHFWSTNIINRDK